MVTYIALLRGINVGGRREVPMARLRAVHERLGHANVATYIQSGNVVFDAEEGSDGLAEMIGAAIAAEFGFEVPVMIRSATELEAVVAAGPFTGEHFDPARVGVAFLDRVPGTEERLQLDADAIRPDEFEIIGREVHFHCPNGFSKTKLTNTFLEKKLGAAATSRNWKTVSILREMAGRDT